MSRRKSDPNPPDVPASIVAIFFVIALLVGIGKAGSKAGGTFAALHAVTRAV